MKTFKIFIFASIAMVMFQTAQADSDNLIAQAIEIPFDVEQVAYDIDAAGSDTTLTQEVASTAQVADDVIELAKDTEQTASLFTSMLFSAEDFVEAAIEDVQSIISSVDALQNTAPAQDTQTSSPDTPAQNSSSTPADTSTSSSTTDLSSSN